MEIVILVIVGTLALIGVVAYFWFARLKREAWEGQLVDKQEETSSGGDYDSTYYVLYVKTLDGSHRRSYVRKKLFDQCAIGDRLVKVQGKAYPSKVM